MNVTEWFMCSVVWPVWAWYRKCLGCVIITVLWVFFALWIWLNFYVALVFLLVLFAVLGGLSLYRLYQRNQREMNELLAHELKYEWNSPANPNRLERRYRKE